MSKGADAGTLDATVADAFGWGKDWHADLLTDDDILARAFHLNQQPPPFRITNGA